MQAVPDNNKLFIPVISALTFGIWIFLQSYIRIPSDAAWLASAAEHILQGQALSQYYFDTNPPLCFIIFIPVVLMDWAGLETWQALQIYTGTLSLIALALSAYFLKFWPISQIYRQSILFFFAIGLFCVPFLEYGQKDHLIGIVLFPFLLAQLGLSYKHDNNKWITILTLLAFAPFILTKPHYGLLPTALLLHRLYMRKNFSVIFNADFIILAIGTISYVSATLIFFPDFVEEVLPLSLPLYVNKLGNPDIHKFAIAMIFLAGCLAGLSASCEKKSEERRLSIFFGVFAILAAIPYWVQWKGFSVHLVPYNIMICIALGASIALYKESAIQKHLKAILGIALVISLSGTSLIWVSKDDLTHDYYRHHALAKILKPTGNEKSFYIESNSTNTALQMSEYLDIEFASRFVANWFTLNLAELPEEPRMHYWHLLGDYYAEDLERYKPETVLLIKNEKYFTILNIFKDHENFQKAFSAYHQDSIIDSDEIFMDGQDILGTKFVPYYVYRRTDKQKLVE